MKEIQLKDILNKEQIKEVLKLIKRDDGVNLRIYLDSIKDDLKKKGVLSDYLYYYLVNAFKLK